MNEGAQRGLNIWEIFADLDRDSDHEPVVCYPWGHDHLKDAIACDDDLRNAVGRIPQGIIRRLVICSSRLTAAGICQTLQMHGGCLLELCISDYGSGSLTGPDLQVALDRCAALRVLEMHGVRAHPPRSARGLQELMLGRRVPVPPMEMAIHFPDLRVLRLWEPRVSPRSDFVLDIVRRCSDLRHIDTWNSELQVTHEMLACLMMCTPHLERFHGNRKGLGLFQDINPQDTVIFPFPEGGQRLPAEGLSLNSIEAFKGHFPAADIFVDWYEMDNLMDAIEQVLA